MFNKLDRLLVEAHKFRAWISQPEAECYSDFLHDYRKEVFDKISTSHDTVDIYRFQGALKVLDTLLGLRDEVDTYIKGVSSGKMRKIEIEKEKDHALGN